MQPLKRCQVRIPKDGLRHSAKLLPADYKAACPRQSCYRIYLNAGGYMSICVYVYVCVCVCALGWK